MNAMESVPARSEHERMLVRFVAELTGLFTKLPALIGFSVLDRATLTAGREAARLDAELSVADLSVDAWPGVHANAPGAEIAAALADLLEEHPSARALLRGFSFARTFH